MEQKERILLVDDEVVFLRSTTQLLKQEGYHCDSTENAASARQLLAEHEYVLMISDIKMPGNTNLEFIHELAEVNNNLPVILITGNPSLDTAIDSVQLPVIAYLTKPFEMNELIQYIEKSMQSVRIKRTIQSTIANLQLWNHECYKLIDSGSKCTTTDMTLTPENFIEYSMQNIVRSMTDMQNVLKLYQSREQCSPVCHMFKCSRLAKLTNVLWDAIHSIERTKDSFKSKELAQLRKKLLEVIKQES
ncbi:response regulator [candidate division KSB1 bacterium]|nr:response regulator [candidate division KSB1 bacterium]